ncbi:hypothetical protein WCWAEYFT_CDS0150 [Vibrio phage VB_VaC_TDDLMA]
MSYIRNHPRFSLLSDHMDRNKKFLLKVYKHDVPNNREFQILQSDGFCTDEINGLQLKFIDVSPVIRTNWTLFYTIKQMKNLMKSKHFMVKRFASLKDIESEYPEMFI